MDARHEIVNAVISGDVATVKRFLSASSPDLARAYSDDGWSLLHLAPNEEVAEALLAHGADIHAKNRHKRFGPGNAPLHVAVYMQRYAVAQLLLDNGANVNATDNAGWTPLHLAAYNGYTDLAQLLLSRGADPNLRTRSVTGAAGAGQSPLAMTQMSGRARDDGTPVAEELDREMGTLLRQFGASE